MNNRRDFIKKAFLASVAAAASPQILAASEDETNPSAQAGGSDTYIVPKGNALKITGTFLDEISHDIPHQNWGEPAQPGVHHRGALRGLCGLQRHDGPV